MPNEDKRNEVSIIQQRTANETGKDPLRFTPSKRIFLQENIGKEEILEKKDVSCFKSNSKILKKKRHKDRIKLFQLNNLWDPTSQIPLLGKSGKYFKKKDKLNANAQMIGGRFASRVKTNHTEKTNQLWSFQQPKPLEYTFDVLSLAANDPYLPIMPKPEHTSKQLGDDLLTSSSSSSLPNASVANELFLGDLIDLSTPNTFNYKANHRDNPLSAHPLDRVDGANEVSDSNPQISILNASVINSKESFSSDTDASQQNHAISEERNSRIVEFEKHFVITSSLIELDDDAQEKSNYKQGDEFQLRSSEASQLPYNADSVGERVHTVHSPIVFYGFPCLISPIDKIENQHIWTSHHSRQMLLDHLNEEPFPKVKTGNAKVPVRRRAFSMDDTLIAYLPSRPLDKIVVSDSPFQMDRAEETSIGEAPPQTSDVSCTTQTVSQPIDTEHFMVESGGDSTLNIQKILPNSNETVLNLPPEFSKSSSMKFSSNIGIDVGNGANIHSYIPPVVEKPSIPEGEYGISLSELPVIHISKEDRNSAILQRNSLESPTMSDERNEVLEKAEGSKEADSELTDLVSESILQLEDQLSPLTASIHCNKKLCEAPEKQSSISPTKSVEELVNNRNSSLHQQVSSDLDIEADLRAIGGSPSYTQETSGRVVNLSNMGNLVKSDGNGSEDSNTLLQSSGDKIPIPLSSGEKILSEDLASDAPLFYLTDFRRVDAIYNGDDINEEPSCTSSSAGVQETPIAAGTGLFSTAPPDNDVEGSNIHLGLEKYSDYSLIIRSAAEVDQNLGREEHKENIPEELNTPTHEIAKSTSTIIENHDNDSSFSDQSCMTPLEHWVLPPGKRFRRSLFIIRNLDEHPSVRAGRGRHYEKSVEEIIRLQGSNADASTPVQSLCKRLSKRRSSWMRQITPPRVRRSNLIWSPTIPDRGTLYETPRSRKSIYSTPMQQNLVSRLSVRTPPMLGPRRSMRSSVRLDCEPASPIQYTIRDLILTICKQAEPCSFSDILSKEAYEGGCKIGEGVFGEVFSITRDSEKTVLKIIPIEGQQLVNGEKQKTYQEVLSELVIAKVLDELRYEGSDEMNLTSGYAEVIATSLVQDSYPKPLLQFWEEFDLAKGSDNENPKQFDKGQLFIVMEQGNGGKDLESYSFSSAKQSLSIFKQIAFSLAVAEISVEFEHRDLHWGNVLVSKTSEKQILYTLNGTQYSVASNGVKSTIIDYTLSRIKYINQVPIYNDIGKDPEMFIATGDYQFDIYRLMKKDVEDDWSRFTPKTNARWLHYLLDKMLTKVKYQRKTAKAHKDSFKVLEDISKWVEGCGSALSIALRLAELKH